MQTLAKKIICSVLETLKLQFSQRFTDIFAPNQKSQYNTRSSADFVHEAVNFIWPLWFFEIPFARVRKRERRVVSRSAESCSSCGPMTPAKFAKRDTRSTSVNRTSNLLCLLFSFLIFFLTFFFSSSSFLISPDKIMHTREIKRAICNESVVLYFGNFENVDKAGSLNRNNDKFGKW